MQICLNCLNKYEKGISVCPHCGFGKWKYKSHEFCLELGDKLKNRYKIGTVIGAGGFGITYRAVDLETGEPVAVKEYYPNGMVSRGSDHKSVNLSIIGKEQIFAKGLNNFLEEAKGLARFRGRENIVQVYDFFEQNGTAYIVMEYLRGKSLAQFASDNGGKLNYDIVANCLIKVLDALEIVHSTGMVHRDLSPDNIFILTDGRIKLIDFGAARESYGNEDKTLSIVLKPNYAPPEQFKKKSRQGPWTDIYALGATAYKILVGSMPPESIGRYMEDDLIRPSTVNSTVPAYFDAIIYKAMALQIENRYQQASAMKYDIINRGVSPAGFNGNNDPKPNPYPNAAQGVNSNPYPNAAQGVNTNPYPNRAQGVNQNPYPNRGQGVSQNTYSNRTQVSNRPNTVTSSQSSKSSTSGVLMIIILSAIGILLVAVIIVAIVKNKGGTSNNKVKSSPSPVVTTEATTEATTESNTSSYGGSYTYGYSIYEIKPIIYAYSTIFEYKGEEIAESAEITYSLDATGKIYTAKTANEIYTDIEIDVDDSGYVEVLGVMSSNYTDDDIKESVNVLEIVYGEYEQYDKTYLWEGDDICVALTDDGSNLYILYMKPEYWERIKNN